MTLADRFIKLVPVKNPQKFNSVRKILVILKFIQVWFSQILIHLKYWRYTFKVLNFAV